MRTALVVATIGAVVFGLVTAVSAQTGAQPSYRCEPLPGTAGGSQAATCVAGPGGVAANCSCPAGYVLVQVNAAPGAIGLPPAVVSR
jgi:hypothetical protein